MSFRLGRTLRGALLVVGVAWTIVGAMTTQASAVPCEVKLAKWVLCSGGNEIVQAPVVGSNESMLFASVVGGAELKLKCEEAGTFKESIWEMKEFGVKFVFKKCKADKPVGCTLANATIVTEPLVGPLEKPGAALEAKFEGLATVFEFELVGGGCLAPGKYMVTGSQKCEAVGMFEAEEKEHQYTCKKTASKLKLGLAVASLSFKITAELTGFAAWSMRLN